MTFTPYTWSIINALALVIGFAGALIIFIYGPPQPNLEEGVGRRLEDGTRLANGMTVKEHNEAQKKLKSRHVFRSRFGIALIGASFLMQLFAAWPTRG